MDGPIRHGVTPDLLLFRHVVEDGEDVDLVVAALVAIEFEYSGLDVAHYVEQVDRFADLASALAESEALGGPIHALDAAFFHHLGFRGNQDDYYDPKNSFLNEVIERRTGIPITLALLYVELGQRMGLELTGVAFPGHFLVRYHDGDRLTFIDPFHRGARLDREALHSRLRRVVGPGAELAAEHLEPAPKRTILLRLLTNLAAIYRRAGDVYRGIAVLERMQVLDPANSRLEAELRALRRRAEGVN
ncbi:MAG TPA: transglutaminase-like domain-containing protein [Kofleriaceae bacterium]|nr:transglutaminase-like domain-containing protein [Kofleriaceae bacterium]